MKDRLHLILLLTLLFFSQASRLQAGESIGAMLEHDFHHFAGVSGALLQSPASFESGQWRYAGFTATAVILLTPLDREVRAFSRRSQSSFNNALFYLDNFYGNHFSLAVPVAFYGFGLFGKRPDVRMTGLRALEALVWAGGINYLMKVFVGRRRPDAGESPYFFKPLQWFDDSYQSFPSGHTTVSFAVSTVIANSMDNLYWKIFWYGSAGIVAGARVYHNRHWLTDVLMGAALGYAVGGFVSDFDSAKERPATALRLQPLISFDRVGVALRF